MREYRVPKIMSIHKDCQEVALVPFIRNWASPVPDGGPALPLWRRGCRARPCCAARAPSSRAHLRRVGWAAGSCGRAWGAAADRGPPQPRRQVESGGEDDYCVRGSLGHWLGRRKAGAPFLRELLSTLRGRAGGGTAHSQARGRAKWGADWGYVCASASVWLKKIKTSSLAPEDMLCCLGKWPSRQGGASELGVKLQGHGEWSWVEPLLVQLPSSPWVSF